MRATTTLTLMFICLSIAYSQDTIPPEAIAIPNFVVEIDAEGNASLTPDQLDDGSTDNISPQEKLQYSLSQTGFSCSDMEVEEYWQVLGGAGISEGKTYYQSLSIAPDGTPYVAYKDVANGGKTTVLQWNGSSWDPLGGAGISAGQASWQSLAIAPDGMLYVAYMDFANKEETTVLHWNGSNWEALGEAGISGTSSEYQSLSIASDGTPYVAYRERHREGKTTVLKWNGSSWDALGGEGISEGDSHYQSLAIASDGTPFIAYQDQANEGKTTVLKWNGSSWVALGGAGISAGGSFYQSLAIAPNGTPYIAYQDWGRHALTIVQVWNGSSWKTLRGTNVARNQTLSFGTDGLPYLAFRETYEGKTVVLKWNTNTWDTLGVAGISDGNSHYQSLSIGPDGTPHVAYWDEFNGNKTTVQKFIQSNRITLTVTDEAGNKAIAGTLLKVEDKLSPVIEAGQSFTIDENGSDGAIIGILTAMDNCSIQGYSISAGNQEKSFAVDDKTGELRVGNAADFDYETTPEFVLSLVVKDPSGNSSSETFKVQLNNLNDNAPQMEAVSEIVGNVMELISFTVTAKDADDAEALLQYSLGDEAPEGAAINASTGTFNWTPTEEQGPGAYTFTVLVSDGELSSTNEVIVRVAEVTGLFDGYKQEQHAFLAYPNPTNGRLFIELKNVSAEEDLAISLLDLNGQQLFQHQGKLRQGTESISAFLKRAKPGVYLLQVKAVHQLQTHRLIRK